jgi:hypothetical protein
MIWLLVTDVLKDLAVSYRRLEGFGCYLPTFRRIWLLVTEVLKDLVVSYRRFEGFGC